MAPRSAAKRSELKSSKPKHKGIHEPKGRVKGFRVEFRPPGSSKKIWVGTFDSLVKAKRAFDAAVYLTGKDPHYFVYPEGYFPSRTPKPSKEEVQISAKKFAERPEDLELNPARSRGPGSKAGQATNVGSEGTSPNTAVAKKVAEQTESPKTLAGLDEFLQDAGYMILVPSLADWSSSDDLALEESKVDLETSAYHRGFTSSVDVMKSVADVPLPAPHYFPAIEDESFYLNFESPVKVASKRKRGGSQETDPLTDLDWLAEGVPSFADGVDDWLASCLNDSWVY